MNTEHRGQESWDAIFQNPLLTLLTGSLLTTPVLDDLVHPRPSRSLDSDERPMTSTSRRPRMRLESERVHLPHIIHPHVGGNHINVLNFEGMNHDRMFNSFFLTFMEQIQASLEDGVKEGLPKEMIEKIKRMKMGKSGQDCSVCSEGFKKGERIRKLPCKHIFHDDCILPWLDVNSTCPNCRFNLLEFFTENPDGNY